MLIRRALRFGRAAGGLVVAAVVLATAALAAPGASERVAREGGTFHVAVVIGRVDTIDPALVNFPPEVQLLDPACATLMAYPDKPLPAGVRLTPSLAEAEPVVSRDGRTHTFTIRRDARFSTGARVTARAFSRALERILDPTMKTGSLAWLDVVGAQDVVDGKARAVAGVGATGRRLTLRLTKRAPDLLDRLTRLCAVPPTLPANSEGARAPLPSAAPYYVAQYVPGERLVLERNRFYRGERPQHVARFVADLAVDPGVAADQVASGTFDTLVPPFLADRTIELAQRYGVNKSRFFVVPAAALRVFHLNTSRPLFRNNVKLRQAVNFAVDRKALAREDGFLVDTPTDQYLAPGTPGYRNNRIYPLDGPELGRARRLAAGRQRGGKAVLYTTDLANDVAQAQIVRQNLGQIGIEVEIKQFPVTLFFDKLGTPGEPFDIARVRWARTPDSILLNCLFYGRTIGQAPSCNLSFFNSPRYNRLLDRASRLTGESRYRAFGELDVQLSRDGAPAIPVAVQNALSFVSARVGCVVVNPLLDLTAVCLKP